jgi:hypothetical protein
MKCLRYAVIAGMTAWIASTVAVQAEDAPKLKIPEVKVDSKAQKEAEKKMEAARKEAECQMEESQKKTREMKKQQDRKAEELRKEAGKGSEQGQAMRKENSKKWWKFWGNKE